VLQQHEELPQEVHLHLVDPHTNAYPITTRTHLHRLNRDYHHDEVPHRPLNPISPHHTLVNRGLSLLIKMTDGDKEDKEGMISHQNSGNRPMDIQARRRSTERPSHPNNRMRTITQVEVVESELNEPRG
jgi:hypothetical protein